MQSLIEDGVSSMDFCVVPRGRSSCRARGPPLGRAGGPLAQRGKAEGGKGRSMVSKFNVGYQTRDLTERRAATPLHLEIEIFQDTFPRLWR